jgi:hypothetical protein
LIRRQNPQHRSLGQFFQTEVAAPPGLEFYIGTPDTLPEERFAVIQEFDPLQTLLQMSVSFSAFFCLSSNPVELFSA